MTPNPQPPLALVTGASAGIGEAFARTLGARGWNLILVARRRDRLTTIARELKIAHKNETWILVQDLARPETPGKIEAFLREENLPVDLLINNAGFGTNGRFAELPLDRELEEIQVNVTSLVALTRLLLPGMIARKKGAIINVGSIGALTPSPYMATYSATKAFVLSFTEALSTELRGTRVHAMALLPGFTTTEFQRVAGLEKQAARGRFLFMSPERVVKVALRALDQKRTICVPGLANKAGVVGLRLIPRIAVRETAGLVMKPPRP